MSEDGRHALRPAREWPGRRLPQTFCDPRALFARPGPRAVLHARCVVVDGERALVTSTNVAEAALHRGRRARGRPGVRADPASSARESWQAPGRCGAWRRWGR
ncbi:MAG: hypothetical protein HY744_20175 [Deltaproteobacteria bacterium]|nr:hypothetical protein [Deltaproteobacteria bacterium]